MVQPVEQVQNQNLSASDVASSLLAIASLSQLQSLPAATQPVSSGQIPALSMCNYSDVTSMPTLSPDESFSDEAVVKRRKGVNFM